VGAALRGSSTEEALHGGWGDSDVGHAASTSLALQRYRATQAGGLSAIRKAVFETGLKFDQHRRGQGLPPVDEVLLPAALKLQE
jgi:hypothetical protein